MGRSRLDSLRVARGPLAIALGDAHDELDDALTAGDAGAALTAAVQAVALREGVKRADALIRAELTRRQTGRPADDPEHATS